MIIALRRLRQGDHKANLGYTVRPCLKKKNTEKNQTKTKQNLTLAQDRASVQGYKNALSLRRVRCVSFLSDPGREGKAKT